ncbi:MAG TPA: dihydrodipicolinate reductase C-terminal domain-containing protein [Thermoanaerobaculia bacterium]|nr:dihydrodipicolinate reductase C-terminal domain-containing protein [Thermoanaerobaculia bacterium]
MRIGIVGTGKMGREIEASAASRGHDVVWRLGSKENPEAKGLSPERLSQADVVFEFTTPASAVANLLALAHGGSRAVCGTTGWSRDLPRVTEAFVRGGGALVHAANFSVGVRHFFELATRAARLYSPAGYAAYMVEEHHVEKRDAPSGTARTVGTIYDMETGKPLPITSVRAGTIPGTHRLVFESPEDEIELVHRARSRAGFAKGAVWAGERIAGKTGVYEFGELLREVS